MRVLKCEECMIQSNKTIQLVDKISFSFEVIIAFILLIVVAIKVVELVFNLMGADISILTMEFEGVLSKMLVLIIGIEFIKMLCKHTPESVIDVLLFAIARQLVIYQDNTMDLFLGIVAIFGLFAARTFFVQERWFRKVKKEERD